MLVLSVLVMRHSAQRCCSCRLRLTISSPVVSTGYTSKCSRPYWSKPPCLIFLTFGHSALSARVPECQKIKKGGLDQYGAERFL